MLIGVSLDHRRAELSVRERFVLPEAERAGIGAAAAATGTGLVLLSTCNRVELYGWVPEQNLADAYARLTVAAHRLSPRLGADYFARSGLLHEADLAGHLFRVTAGLASQVAGDVQVLRQVREAYGHAVAAGAAGAELHRLFQAALRAGRRVQAETTLGATGATVAGQAIRMAERVLGPLGRRDAIVLGCGSVGRAAARQLRERSAEVTLINRTDTVSATLARKLGARAVAYGARHGAIADAALTIVATGAAGPTVEGGPLAAARAVRGAGMRPMLVLDLSMPRNVSAEIRHFPAVTLLDLQHLAGGETRAEGRRAALGAAEQIVVEELDRYAADGARRAERTRAVA